jgi:hypothetical protein
MNSIEVPYTLDFKSDDGTTEASVTIDEADYEKAYWRAFDIARRRKENGITGVHTLVCPDGKEVPVKPE